MRAEQDIELYLATIIQEDLHSNKRSLQFEMDTLFGGIDFKNKRVLDIGGGSGLYSFYAACRGAKKVVCLEPEAEGCSSGAIKHFQKLNRIMELSNVILEPVAFQAFEANGSQFDIILLHNSINHLNETACINLLKDASSTAIYQEILSKISALSNKGTKLLICDCSRYNFFGLLKIRNPFVPTIAWHKHHAPEVWASMLGDVGFVNPAIRWSSFNRLGWWGRVLTGNKLMAYFLTSHFCLTMEKA